MKFEESNVLQQLPKQFFAGLVKKVNAKVATGADVINGGGGIRISRLPILLSDPCRSKPPYLPIINIRNSEVTRN